MPSAGYGFESYLAALRRDWYADDDLLRHLLDRYAPDADRGRLVAFGPTAAGRLRALAEESARPGNAPRLRRRDAFDRRVDAVELPGSTLEALRLVEGGVRLGAVHGDPFVHYAMVYILAQNGEAGVACSLACTDGLVRALDALGDRPIHHDVAAAVRASTPERYIHGAQFVTEIQGGSDIPANQAAAVREGDAFRISGRKWFCSNINADWFLVTARARPPGRDGADDDDPVGLFLVPAFVALATDAPAVTPGLPGRPGQPPADTRNGYTIERLKEKLGTRELATAEVAFDGALAWQVGPLDRGIANLLRYVLTPSRIACVVFAAAALRRAERITRAYAEFRSAFGRPIADYPLVARTLDGISAAREEALGCLFELVRRWEAAESDEHPHRDTIDFRVLLSLAKPVLTRRATTLLHEAMMLLGGNGIEEEFSPLPRLYRDAVIMETWEGPHNVLFTQALRDMTRFGIDPDAFLRRVTGEARPALRDALAAAFAEAEAGDAGAGALALADAAPSLVSAVGAAAVTR